jgi:hypothetical protein
MEKEDQLIKELIKEGFLKSAPDDFTDNVMNAVAKTEIREKSVYSDSTFLYVAIATFALILAGCIIFFTDFSFYSTSFAFFRNLLSQLLLSFSGVFSGSVKLNAYPDSPFLVGGIIAIIVMLLLFDMLLNKHRKVIGLFV